MKPIFAIAMLAICSSSFASGQTASGMATNDVQQNLMRMEQEGVAAMLKGDTAIMERDAADSYTFTAPDGTTSTKAESINSVKNGDLKFESSVISDVKVMQYGDSAVVTYTTTDKGSYKGNDISGTYRWTDVWVKRGGKWQVVAGQGTPVTSMMKKT